MEKFVKDFVYPAMLGALGVLYLLATKQEPFEETVSLLLRQLILIGSLVVLGVGLFSIFSNVSVRIAIVLLTGLASVMGPSFLEDGSEQPASESLEPTRTEESPAASDSGFFFLDEFADNRNRWDLGIWEDDLNSGDIYIEYNSLVFDIYFDQTSVKTIPIPIPIPENAVLEFDVIISQPPPEIWSSIVIAVNKGGGRDYSLFRLRNSGYTSNAIVDCSSSESEELGNCIVPNEIEGSFSSQTAIEAGILNHVKIQFGDFYTTVFYENGGLTRFPNPYYVQRVLSLGIHGEAGSRVIAFIQNLKVTEID